MSDWMLEKPKNQIVFSYLWKRSGKKRWVLMYAKSFKEWRRQESTQPHTLGSSKDFQLVPLTEEQVFYELL